MDPIPTMTADEQAKRAAVLAALQDACDKGKLNIVSIITGIREMKLVGCLRDGSLGTLSQAEIDWLSVDLRE